MGQTLAGQANKLVDARLNEHDIRMMARMLLQTVIPRYATDERETGIENGFWEIGIQAGYKEKLPSGSLPRLILIWVIAEAIRSGSRSVELGRCLSEFMEALGIKEQTGGRWGTITRVKTASRQLFNSRVTIRYTGPKGYAVKNVQFADEIHTFWIDADARQTDIEAHKVILSDPFFRVVMDSPFPIDMNILTALAKSPLGIDLYAWLAQRMYNVHKPTPLTWEQLHVQMGGTYSEVKNFARDARRELKKIKAAWPGLNYQTLRGRLLLLPSVPSIPESKPRRLPAAGA